MTTDYSADVRALLESLQGPPPEMTFTADEMLRVANSVKGIIELMEPMQQKLGEAYADLDAARAEAQRLREQRDAYKEMVERFIQDCKDCVVIKYNGTPRYEPTYGDNDLYEWRAMLDTIAAEDASAQGGE